MFGWRSCAQARLSRTNRSSGAGTLHIREDDFDRDVVAEQHPARAIHRAHAPFGERREDLVAAVQDLPDREHGQILTGPIPSS